MKNKEKNEEKALSLEELQIKATKAIEDCEKLVESETGSKKVNAINALSGLIDKYSRLVKQMNQGNKKAEQKPTRTRGTKDYTGLKIAK